ncbi:MAG: MFS transporter [Treponema sp.]|jgi:sugar (glycoside-pentoside-hexuronide) transporter|nr:MFS transporter [Treponema sp.]
MSERTGLKTRFAYGLSDVASNLSWGTVGSYLMVYYTDVAKIPAIMIGTMFLITRVWDAVNDPIMGLIIDKTHSRWGKARPYFLWMCVPLAIVMVLTYSVPAGWSVTGKLIYVYITFTFLGMIYTAINIPVTAILPRLSADLHDRTVLGTFRGFGALIGQVLVMAITLPLVAALGQGDTAKGYQLTMAVFGIMAVLFFLITFFNVKEIDLEEKKSQKTSFMESVKAIRGNLPWLITLLVGLLLQMSMAMRMAGMVYYCRYYLGNEGLIPLLGMLMMVMIFPLACLPAVSKKIGKRNTVITGSIIAIAGNLLIWLGGKTTPAVFITANVLVIAGMAFTLGLIFVLVADTVEYGEWKNGVRSEGFLSAASSLGQKLGTGFGGALAAWVLGSAGYEANAVEQSRDVLNAMVFNFVGFPLLSFVLIIILMWFYRLDKTASQMMSELAQRRALNS